jgi:hypothetical protein
VDIVVVAVHPANIVTTETAIMERIFICISLDLVLNVEFPTPR